MMTEQGSFMKQIAVVDKYIEAWNETSKKRRMDALVEVWANSGRYIDPRANLVGREALVDHIEKIRDLRPGATIVRTSELEVHNQIGRFKWRVILADRSKLPEGLDIVFFSKENRCIEKIIGFFGELKALS